MIEGTTPDRLWDPERVESEVFALEGYLGVSGIRRGMARKDKVCRFDAQRGGGLS
jgi:hypothetical protein